MIFSKRADGLISDALRSLLSRLAHHLIYNVTGRDVLLITAFSLDIETSGICFGEFSEACLELFNVAGRKV